MTRLPPERSLSLFARLTQINELLAAASRGMDVPMGGLLPAFRYIHAAPAGV